MHVSSVRPEKLPWKHDLRHQKCIFLLKTTSSIQEKFCNTFWLHLSIYLRLSLCQWLMSSTIFCIFLCNFSYVSTFSLIFMSMQISYFIINKCKGTFIALLYHGTSLILLLLKLMNILSIL